MTDAPKTSPGREALAALEHTQWAHWTRYMIDSWSPEAVQRWERQIATPYEELSEAEKDSDRAWADRTIKTLVDLIVGHDS